MWQDIIVYSIGIGILGIIIQKMIHKIKSIKKKEICSSCPSCKTCNQRKKYNIDNKNVKYCSERTDIKTRKK